jgi:hypothetical protein
MKGAAFIFCHPEPSPRAHFPRSCRNSVSARTWEGNCVPHGGGVCGRGYGVSLSPFGDLKKTSAIRFGPPSAGFFVPFVDSIIPAERKECWR